MLTSLHLFRHGYKGRSQASSQSGVSCVAAFYTHRKCKSTIMYYSFYMDDCDKHGQQQVLGRCGETGNLIHCWWEYNFQSSLAVPQKIK